MGLIIRILLVLVVLGFAGLVAFAYWPGALDPAPSPVSRPVDLDVD